MPADELTLIITNNVIRAQPTVKLFNSGPGTLSLINTSCTMKRDRYSATEYLELCWSCHISTVFWYDQNGMDNCEQGYVNAYFCSNIINISFRDQICYCIPSVPVLIRQNMKIRISMGFFDNFHLVKCALRICKNDMRTSKLLACRILCGIRQL